MIKAVLDTNVIVSGFVSLKHPTTPPAQILQAWRTGKFHFILSEHILAEVERTLDTRYFRRRLSNEEIEQALLLLTEECIIADLTVSVQGVATHPEDDLTLSTAINAQADFLVTGDGALLREVGNEYQGIKLLTPTDFLKKL